LQTGALRLCVLAFLPETNPIDGLAPIRSRIAQGESRTQEIQGEIHRRIMSFGKFLWNLSAALSR
jgi:hypothetical protein